MEYYPLSLHYAIYSCDISNEIKKSITLDIISGLMFLHSSDIIHRDLKPANILLDKSYQAKISDFGTAKVISISNSTQKIIGTPYYIAPESIENFKYTKETDLYSLGIIIYEIYHQIDPYPEFNIEPLPSPFIILNKIHKEQIRPKISTTIEITLKELIERLLNVEPNKRRTLSEARDIISLLLQYIS